MFEGATAQQLFDMVKRVEDGQGRIHERLNAGQETFSEIRQSVARIEVDVAHLKDGDLRKMEHIDRLHDRLSSLEAERQERRGRDGVIAAILRSPIGASIMAVWVTLTAVWAWLKSGAGSVP